MAAEDRLRRKGISPASGEVRYVQRQVDTVRGDDEPYGFPLQAPDDAEADTVAVHQYRHQLHEPGGAALERDIPDREGELQHRLRGCFPAG